MSVDHPLLVDCENCHGSGIITRPDGYEVGCPECHGSGMVGNAHVHNQKKFVRMDRPVSREEYERTKTPWAVPYDYYIQAFLLPRSPAGFEPPDPQWRLLITVSSPSGVSTEVVEFRTRREAEGVVEAILNRGGYSPFGVLKLYPDDTKPTESEKK